MIKTIMRKIHDVYDDWYPNTDPVIEISCKSENDVFNVAESILLENCVEYKVSSEETDDLLPYVKVNDTTLLEPQSVIRCFGAISRTFPRRDPINLAIVDEWLELHSKFMIPFEIYEKPESFGLKFTENEKKDYKKWCIESHAPPYLEKIENNLSENEWISMDSKSVADFCWLDTLNWFIKYIENGHYPEIISYVSRNSISD